MHPWLHKFFSFHPSESLSFPGDFEPKNSILSLKAFAQADRYCFSFVYKFPLPPDNHVLPHNKCNPSVQVQQHPDAQNNHSED